MTTSLPRPELLAPAGDWDCLRAAASAGADAVYFGLTRFSARARATNFPPEELEKVMTFLRDRRMKGYVAFNTLVFPDELEAAAALIERIAAAGCDAVIVQDAGLARLAQRMAPMLPVHASTQMSLAEPHGIELVRNELGASRVILPRELSVEQIGKIATATDVELEVFVHGAICISYSGQCLASLSLGGRSANRGECAQPCRLPYELLLDGKPPTSRARPYPLSPRDLAAWELLPDLVRLGVRGFKIEGRLKSAAYVAAVTAFYRKALDAAIAGRAFTPAPEDLAALAQSFSRGFTKGYLAGTNHAELVEGLSPKPRGLRVGTVTAKTQAGVVVSISTGEIRAGDGLVFEEPDGANVAPQGGRVFIVKPRQGRQSLGAGAAEPNLVEITFGHGCVDLAAIAPGSAVWKTDDPVLEKRLARESAERPPEAGRREKLDVQAAAALGGSLKLVFRDESGREVPVEWPGPLTRAEKHPLTVELLAAQLGRLGDSPFELGKIDAPNLAPAMVPKSILNDLRRQAVARLLEMRATSARHQVTEQGALAALRKEAPAPAWGTKAGPRLYVLVRSMEQLEAVTKWQPAAAPLRPELVYCDLEDAGRWSEAVEAVHAAGLRAGLVAPRVIEPGEEGLLRKISAAGPDVVLAPNLATVEFFRGKKKRPELVGDFGLNAANDLSAGWLLSLGLARLVPAADLDQARVTALVERLGPERVELPLNARQQMFHTKHCLHAAAAGGASCAECRRPCAEKALVLRDRKGVTHQATHDAAGRSTVHSGRELPALEVTLSLATNGLRHFRLELLDENARRTEAILARAAGALARAGGGR